MNVQGVVNELLLVDGRCDEARGREARHEQRAQKKGFSSRPDDRAPRTMCSGRCGGRSKRMTEVEQGMDADDTASRLHIGPLRWMLKVHEESAEEEHQYVERIDESVLKESRHTKEGREADGLAQSELSGCIVTAPGGSADDPRTGQAGESEADEEDLGVGLRVRCGRIAWTRARAGRRRTS